MAPDSPDVVLVPSGDGVILAGLAKGFRDLQAGGLTERLPRLIAVQPEGSSALVDAARFSKSQAATMGGASSVADSLTVETPRNAIGCLAEIRASGGGGVTVSDDAILASISRLAGATGLFAEPAGAAALAGLETALEEGLVDREERVVLMITGTGLKDVGAAASALPPLEPVEADLDSVERAVFERQRFSSK
jgi:threonine synthase